MKKSINKTTELDSTRLEIICSVFNLEVSKGHLKWSVSQIARDCKISRTLVYYHFGRTKQEILLNCLEVLTRELYGLNGVRNDFKKTSLLDSLLSCHDLYSQVPSYSVFCQKWARKQSIYRDKYLQLQKIYDEKLKVNFPNSTLEQRLSLRAYFYGLVAAPSFERELITEALQLLRLGDLK